MALGNDVGDTHDFKHGAHGAAGDDAGSLGSRSHHHIGRTVVTHHLVVDRTVFQADLDHVATGFFHRFLHSSWHFFRLALAHADAAIAITDHGQCCETENTTTLYHFGNAVDRDHLFAQTVLWPFGLALHFCLYFSHLYFRSA